MRHYPQLAAERLDELGPEERNCGYKTLNLTVLAHPDGSPIAAWGVCNVLPLPPGNCRTPGR